MQNFYEKLGLRLIIFLSLLPVFFWFIFSSMQIKFGNFSTSIASFGQIFGLAGMSLFSINLFLSGRFKFLEKYFRGLNDIYVIHHKTGAIAFMLILFHPIFLAISKISISFQSASSLLFFFGNWPVNFGIISILLLIISLFITFYVSFPYQIWKFSHKFLGLAFFFASFHIFLIGSDVENILILRIYMFSLAMMGIIAYSYRVLFYRFFVEKFYYFVENIKKLNEKIIEIIIKPKKEKLNFVSGQFTFLKFKQKGISSETHPFSITSSTEETNLRFDIKSLGDFTDELKNLSVGAEVEVEGPFGRFSFQNYQNKNQIWVAGGIGITPFLSMARSLKDKNNKDYKIDLYYCLKTKNEAIFLSELEQISKSAPSFKVILWVSDEKGRINAQEIKKLSGDVSEKEIFLCGPFGMVQNIKNQFVEIGISKSFLHSEEFQL